MDYKKSIEELEKILDELRLENRFVPIIVEGEKDISALHRLDINGLIVSINSGKSLTDFCDEIADIYDKVIVLTDWDRRGGYLCHTIVRNLEGRVFCNTYYREFFAKNCMIKTVEGLPSWIFTMKEKNRVF